MHASAMEAARKFAEEHVSVTHQRVADIGALDMNGSMRGLFAGREYVGMDIEPGKGVDMVLANSEAIPVADRTFDVVLSANTLEHTRRPWVVVREMARILRPGGLMFLLIPMPNAHRFHAHPIDCWRCYTEGMRGLLDGADLEVLELYEAGDHDTVGIARKR